MNISYDVTFQHLALGLRLRSKTKTKFSITDGSLCNVMWGVNWVKVFTPSAEKISYLLWQNWWWSSNDTNFVCREQEPENWHIEEASINVDKNKWSTVISCFGNSFLEFLSSYCCPACQAQQRGGSSYWRLPGAACENNCCRSVCNYRQTRHSHSSAARPVVKLGRIKF